MNKLLSCALLPHPPIMIPEIGQAELHLIAATVKAANEVAEQICAENPQTIIIVTPHGPVIREDVSISIHPRLRGSFEAFGAPEISLGFETDGLLSKQIIKKSERLGINLEKMTDDLAKTYRFKLELDHGALVPLYYLHKAGYRGQIVHISVGHTCYEEVYTFGKAVRSAIDAVDRRVAVIASGDLSHRLTPNAPCGYSEQGIKFDQEVIAALGKLDGKALFNLDRKLIEDAGECGLRSIFFLIGVLGGLNCQADILSYEGPFGVGYAVGLFKLKD